MIAIKAFKNVATPAALLLMAGLIVHDRLTVAEGGSTGRPVDGAALGRAYAPVLASTYADAWLAAARSIEEGTSVAEAQRVLQTRWSVARIKAFRTQVQPGFSLELPEGTEPAGPTQRARVAVLWRAFAAGLKDGR